MEEGTSKAIPLRRARAAAAQPRRWTENVAAAVRQAVASLPVRRPAATAAPPAPWSGPVAGAVGLAIASPRQLWLASLGGTALALRRFRALWWQLVAEGTRVESWLGRSLRRGAGSETQT